MTDKPAPGSSFRSRTCVLMGVAVALLLACPTLLASEGNPNTTQDLSGVIEYRDTKTNAWRGEDRFRLTVHPDGSRTMRDATRLDNTLIFRDAIMRVDANYHPLDVYVSHWLDGKHRGTAFYQVEGDTIHSTVNAPNGTLQQTLRIADRFSVATRPQATFGWHFGYYDFDKGGKQLAATFLISRLGDTVGSILGESAKFWIQLLEDRPFETPAGTFDAWKFELVDYNNPDHRYEAWIEKENFITLQLLHEEQNRIYELIELGPTYPE